MALSDSTAYDSYVKAGLDKAKGLVQNMSASQYTPYVSSAVNAPKQTQFYDYQASSPLQQINAPNYQLSAGNAPSFQRSNYDVTPQTASWNNYNASAYGQAAPSAQTVNPNASWNGYSYQGLMGGDYDALQNALMQPGQLAATNAYNTGTQNLNNSMSGRGLYGSSIMAQQQIQGLDREYQNALATNAASAAATRYGMQQQDLQKAGDIAAQQNLAMNAANQQNADRGLQQATSLNELSNSQYLARLDENKALQQLMMQQNLAKNAQGMQQAELTQQGLLANAANLLNADSQQNDFGLNMYAQKLAEQKDINAYQSSETAGLRDQAMNAANFGLQQADMQNQYNNLKYNAQKEYDTNLMNWQNQQNYEQNYLYPQAKQAFDQAQQEMLINQALALAGQGAPLSTANQNAQLKSQEIAAQQAAAQKNYEAQLWSAGAGLLGQVGSSYLDNYTGLGTFGLSTK